MPKKYTKKESIIYWVIGLAIVFGSPYLIASINENTCPVYDV